MTEAENSAQLKKNRLQLIAILAIVLIPALGSTFMYYTGIGLPQGTSNNGVLVEPPLNVSDISLSYSDGGFYRWETSGKFRLALLIDGVCDQECADLLRDMRQVHVRLAKRASSLERWLVQLDGEITDTKVTGLEQSLAESYPTLVRLRGDYYEWRERLAENAIINTDFNGHQLLLVDRRGHAIMVFDSEQSGQPMMDDILFLIKSTQ